MKTRIISAFLALTLAACAPVAKPIPTTTTTTTTLVPATATPTKAAIPTEQIVVFLLTPNPGQVANWQQYQTEMAAHILGDGKTLYPHPETALCEWDILDKAYLDFYLWVICQSVDANDAQPVVLHLNQDGSIKSVETPSHNSEWQLEMNKLFPQMKMQEKIMDYFTAYHTQPRTGKTITFVEHLAQRLQPEHQGEPPLIILSVKPAP